MGVEWGAGGEWDVGGGGESVARLLRGQGSGRDCSWCWRGTQGWG